MQKCRTVNDLSQLLFSVDKNKGQLKQSLFKAVIIYNITRLLGDVFRISLWVVHTVIAGKR